VSESLSSSPAARIGVITFPGTLDDVDAARAVRLAGAEPVSLWHKDADLRGVDAVVVPGGFSYGDYLRCGAIARFAPVMEEGVAAAGATVSCARVEEETSLGSSSVTTPMKPTRTPSTSLMEIPRPSPSALRASEPDTFAARTGNVA